MISARRLATLAALGCLAISGALAACGAETGTGGTGGSGGSGGNGGSGSKECLQVDCIRAVICVVSCDAKPIQVGCCPCPVGTFDVIACMGEDG